MYSAWAFSRSELFGLSHSCETQFDRKEGRCCRDFFDCLGVEWVVWIPPDRGSGKLWIYFLQQLQPFWIKFHCHHREPGDVSARMRQALDQAGPDWIEDEGHYDGDSRCGTLGHLCTNSTVVDDHIDVASN
jgi:hypothetical protein